LNKLLEKANFDIILSSARRKNVSIKKFNEFFKNRRIIQKIVAYTPLSANNSTRKEEIEKYIIKNNIENFLILDDDKTLNSLPVHFKKYLVLTNPMVGFNGLKLNEALEIVNLYENVFI